jgi:hypothetical protein
MKGYKRLVVLNVFAIAVVLGFAIVIVLVLILNDHWSWW